MRWMATPGLALGVLTAAVLGAGCRAGSDPTVGTPASSAPPAVAPLVTGSTGGATVAGASAAAAGDEICARVDAQIAAVPPPAGPTEVEPYLRRLVATYRGEVAELRGLADRTDDPRWQQLVAALSAYFDLVEADLPGLAQAPDQMNAPGTPTGLALDRARHLAEELGLRVCGASGSGSSADRAAPTPAASVP